MTERQVIAVLGEPLRTRPWGPNGVIYDYALPTIAIQSCSLWIHFEKGSVVTVQGKRHRLIGEDYAVYEARAGSIFEGPDFESTFARLLIVMKGSGSNLNQHRVDPPRQDPSRKVVNHGV